MENVIFLIVGLILFFIGNKKSQKYEKNIDSQKKEILRIFQSHIVLLVTGSILVLASILMMLSYFFC